MALTIRSLLSGRDRPVTVAPSERLSVAIDRMLEHDYTQLPVTVDGEKLVGMVTSDSILRAMEALVLRPQVLTVADAMFKPRSFDPDADVSELLNALRDQYAALVVDGDGRLIGIITGFDASEYFRGRSEDMMLVADIESNVKDHVRAAFRDKAGKVDEVRLADAIMRADPTRSLRGRAEKAIRLYVSRAGEGTIDQDRLDDVLGEVCHPGRPQTFEDLTLSQYIDLLLHPSVWPAYSDVFGVEGDALRRLLDNVREIRNALAHFRGEISATERAHLRYCATWLERHPPKPLPPSLPPTPAPMPQPATQGDSSDIVPVDDVEPGEGRYAKLAVWLEKRSPDQDLVALSFIDIEGILDGPLPPTAREHRSWWANDSVSHPQSQRWLEVGWRVASISLTGETVTFARIEEREKSYISFFSKLIARLEQEKSFVLRTASPAGVSWHVLSRLPDTRVQLG